MTHWCILRTSGARTLPLARSLHEAGFDVWTPKQTKSVRRPGVRVKTGGKPEMVDRDQPIMPTFVFARSDRVADLFRVLALPINPHPSFSVFHYAGRIPLIADHEVAALRKAEEQAERRSRRSQRYIFGKGMKVRAEEPAFVGLVGVVEDSDGKTAWVRFGPTFRMKIATWLLRADNLLAA